jgi:hypothetical protein
MATPIEASQSTPLRLPEEGARSGGDRRGMAIGVGGYESRAPMER